MAILFPVRLLLLLLAPVSQVDPDFAYLCKALVIKQSKSCELGVVPTQPPSTNCDNLEQPRDTICVPYRYLMIR